LQIQKVHRNAWKLFKHHHYLDTHINPTAQCWVAWWNEQPVAFTSWIHSMSNFKGKREHRTVTLPDYQGVGIGHALSTHIAAMWKALGFRASSTTTHPAFIAARRKDPNWIITRNPSFASRDARNLPKLKHATTRLTAGFEYVGPPLPFTKANALNDQS
jgi:GNAT superfamily N-acetyltransferase